MKRKSNSNRFFFFMSSNLSMLRHSDNKQCDHVRKKARCFVEGEMQTFMTTKVWVERKRGLWVSNSSSCSSSIGMVYFSS